jgi:hypothetical protein
MTFLSPSFKWIPVFLLVLLFGYSAYASSVEAQESIECDQQSTDLPVDCPPSSEDVSEINNEIDDGRGNIEEQIPSVLPFP